jgi:hypothetical protein
MMRNQWKTTNNVVVTNVADVEIDVVVTGNFCQLQERQERQETQPWWEKGRHFSFGVCVCAFSAHHSTTVDR